MTPVDIEAGKDVQAKLEKSQEINRQVDRAEALEVNLSVASDRAPPTWDRPAAHPHGGTRGVIRPPNLVGILSKAIGSEPSRRPFKEVQATGRKLKPSNTSEWRRRSRTPSNT